MTRVERLSSGATTGIAEDGVDLGLPSGLGGKEASWNFS